MFTFTSGVVLVIDGNLSLSAFALTAQPIHEKRRQENETVLRSLKPWSTAFLASFAVMALLTSCAGTSNTVPANTVIEQFDQLEDDMLGALSTVGAVQWARASDGFVQYDSPCRFWAGSWRASEPLSDESGTTTNWEPWREVLDPVLREHGFDALSEELQTGDFSYLQARGPGDAQFRIYDVGKIELGEIRIDADPCENETLGLESEEPSETRNLFVLTKPQQARYEYIIVSIVDIRPHDGGPQVELLIHDSEIEKFYELALLPGETVTLDLGARITLLSARAPTASQPDEVQILIEDDAEE